jgi:hypothetical protein
MILLLVLLMMFMPKHHNGYLVPCFRWSYCRGGRTIYYIFEKRITNDLLAQKELLFESASYILLGLLLKSNRLTPFMFSQVPFTLLYFTLH